MHVWVAPAIKCDRTTKLKIRTVLWARLQDRSKRVWKRVGWAERPGTPVMREQVIVAEAGQRVPFVWQERSGGGVWAGHGRHAYWDEGFTRETRTRWPPRSGYRIWDYDFFFKIHVKRVGMPGWIKVKSEERPLAYLRFTFHYPRGRDPLGGYYWSDRA